MATRGLQLLLRGQFRGALIESPRIPRYPRSKNRAFSQIPTLSAKIPLKSRENSRFSRQVSLAHLLLKYGFPQSQLHEFVQKNPFLWSSTSSEVEKSIGVLLSLGLSQDSLVSTLVSCPGILELDFLRKWQLGFARLGLSNISSSSIQRFLVGARRFGIQPEDLCRKVSALKATGFSEETVCKVFVELPEDFARDDFDVGHTIDFLKRTGVENDEIDRICYLYPGLLAFSIESWLRPLFEEIQGLGFSRNEIKKALLNSPSLLVNMEVGELSRCMDLLNCLKCRVPIKKRILSKGPLRASIDVKLRVDFLCKYGLIHRDAFKVLWMEPRTILYGLEDLEKKIEFLLHKIELNIGWLVEFPDYLGMNLEKQIVPRYNVIEYLGSIGGLGFEVGLKHLVKFSRLKFYNLFVKPYPECEKIFGGVIRQIGVKPRHPAGLWKLFKPQKFPITKEDVRNMKSFMEPLVQCRCHS